MGVFQELASIGVFYEPQSMWFSLTLRTTRVGLDPECAKANLDRGAMGTIRDTLELLV